jgi:hypothetical protein
MNVLLFCLASFIAGMVISAIISRYLWIRYSKKVIEKEKYNIDDLKLKWRFMLDIDKRCSNCKNEFRWILQEYDNVYRTKEKLLNHLYKKGNDI